MGTGPFCPNSLEFGESRVALPGTSAKMLALGGTGPPCLAKTALAKNLLPGDNLVRLYRLRINGLAQVHCEKWPTDSGLTSSLRNLFE